METFYLSKQDICKNYNWSNEKINKLIRLGHLNIITTTDRGIRITTESVEQYHQSETFILENYIPNLELLNMLGYTSLNTNIIQKLESTGYIDTLSLDYPINSFIKWVSKKSVHELFKKLEHDFITFEFVQNQYNLTEAELYLKIRIDKITTIKIRHTLYLKRDEINIQHALYELQAAKNRLYTKHTIMQTKNWSAKKVNQLIESGLLQVITEEQRELITSISLAKYCEFENKINQNYVSARQALLKYFGYSDEKSVTGLKLLYSLQEHGFLELKEFSDYKIKGSSLWVTKDSLDRFLNTLKNDFTESKALMKELNWKKHQYDHRLKHDGWFFLRIKGLTYIHNSSLSKYRVKSYRIHEALDILGIPRRKTIKLYYHQIFNMSEGYGHGKKYIPETEVNRIKLEIENYRNLYYTTSEVLDILGVASISEHICKQINYIPCPYIARSFAGGSRLLFEKESVHEYHEKTKYHRLNEKLNQVNGAELVFSTPTDYLKYHISEYSCEPCHAKTKILVMQFAAKKLTLSKASPSTKEAMAKELIIFVHTLFDLMPKKEIFQLTTNEFKVLMQSDSRFSIKKNMYEFVKHTKNTHLCKIELKEIEKPKEIRRDNQKELYDFEQFISLYKYATDIALHRVNAIASARYASTWLYVLMHLSNAWRHSDVMATPPIFPEAIGINNMNWFLNNQLTLPQGQTIINQLFNFELIISKTGMKRHFFCNKDLVLPISTAMVICEFYRRKTNREYLIDFDSKNNRVPESALAKFFEQDESFYNGQLKFSSLKMNRSLMTHLFYSIQLREGKGNSAFELVQKLRNHVTDITKEYILNDEEKLSEVSKNLFDRGEFGYIFDQLLDVLDVDKPSRSLQERTNAIVKLKQRFLPHQVESFSDFLDTMELDKKTIIMQIHQFTKEEAFEYIRKIYLGGLPSKMEHIQCFSHPKCHRPSAEYKCNSCPYAIPNIYALTALSNDIRYRVEKYHSMSKTGAKQREYVLLQRSMDLLLQALDEFDEAFVWSFIPGGENFIEEQLNTIEEVSCL
ncbi:hypothetical protein [Paenibacillus alginolyticus]|uniref:DNA-binding protein n=1 Tax=Paenibacillus alginolyticus TaxID=59839 RepID=A0ABT4GEC4_9BACL|nr:hypothetical protein [Paenibacillus alginolyticus]MCY9694546.1 hypothetical protein [Paenibacillus alginolyticus]MEC0142707.1 hypothetical protein [Paenibacillus alginolyticus]